MTPWLLASVYVLGLAGLCLLSGLLDWDERNFILVVAWPLTILMFVAALPFIGLYYLGRKLAKVFGL